ncbi:MAG: Rieske 2Fe-2S domain-containing protein [Candidatus Heimdallarchaeota archaeon]|nr:Rieske 2Fe-2S domain-containing protein [Candidatus Heimdallarchaeota archaeon]MDH5645747.1 Rieske 2Fe-2S domain-containing protein [Candidatus Heimdallarchaeota archaeon]
MYDPDNHVEVCNIEDIPDDKLMPVNIEGEELMVVKIDGKYIVSSRICSHKYYDLTKGHFADGYVTCMLHTSIFEVESGEPQNPPAIETLQTYETLVKDGKLYIKI